MDFSSTPPNPPITSPNSDYILNFQFIASDIDELLLYEPAWVGDLKTAKGMIRIDNQNAGGSLAIDAGVIEELGRQLDNSAVAMIWGSSDDIVKLIGEEGTSLKVKKVDS